MTSSNVVYEVYLVVSQVVVEKVFRNAENYRREQEVKSERAERAERALMLSASFPLLRSS